VGPDISDRIRQATPVVVIGTPIGTFTSADTPLAIPDVTTIQSHILINDPGFAGLLASDVNVHVRLDHTFDFDLQITLIPPSGQRIVLSQNRGGDGDNFGIGIPPAHTPTVFDDQAATPIAAGAPPFVGSFRPDDPLALANGESVNGDWILEIADQFFLDSGTLFTWSLELSAGTAITVLNSGNKMDQDADSVRGEANQDVYAVPRSLNNVPFTLPYDPNTLPIIVPGPHVVSTLVPLTVPVQSIFQVPTTPDGASGRDGDHDAAGRAMATSSDRRHASICRCPWWSSPRPGGHSPLTATTPHGLQQATSPSRGQQAGYNGVHHHGDRASRLLTRSPSAPRLRRPGPSPWSEHRRRQLQYIRRHGHRDRRSPTPIGRRPQATGAHPAASAEAVGQPGLNSTNNGNLVFDRDMDPPLSL
jgi:subtilisin-like proprotein convertase family protein